MKKKGNIFYVYIYLDPRKKGEFRYGKYKFEYCPFYVGKGHGERVLSFKRDRNPLLMNKLRKVFSPFYLMVKTNLSESEAFTEEKKAIKIIGRIDLGTGPLCNLTDGGEGHSGYVTTKVTRKKLSEALTGRSLSQEAIEKLKKAHTGKVISKETIEKMRKVHTGKYPSKETRLKMSLWQKGRRHSESENKKNSESHKGKKMPLETREKIRITSTGRKQSDEAKRKLSVFRTGKHHSEETKQKMRNSQLARSKSN